MRMNDNISYAELTAILSAPTPRVMVANVLHGGHFVLAIGVDAVSNDTVRNEMSTTCGARQNPVSVF